MKYEEETTGFDQYEFQNQTTQDWELLFQLVKMNREILDVIKQLVEYIKTTEESATATLPQVKGNIWLNSKDVMKQLKISPRTLQYLRTNKKIRFKIVGNRCRYRQKYIDDYMTKYCNNSSGKIVKSYTTHKPIDKKQKRG